MNPKKSLESIKGDQNNASDEHNQSDDYAEAVKDVEFAGNKLTPESIAEPQETTTLDHEKIKEAFLNKDNYNRIKQKLENKEPLTKEEYETIYGFYDIDDDDVQDIKSNFIAFQYDGSVTVQDAIKAGVDATKLTAYLMKFNAEAIGENLDSLMEAGVKIDFKNLANELLNGNDSSASEYVFDNIDTFLAHGVDGMSLIDWYQGPKNDMFDQSEFYELVGKCLNAHAVDANKLANQLLENEQEDVVARNLKAFLDAGAKIEPTDLLKKLDKQGDYDFINYNVGLFLDVGVNPTVLIDMVDDYCVIHNIDKFLAAGADPMQLLSRLSKEDLIENMDKLLVSKMNPITLARLSLERGDSWTVLNEWKKFLDAGAEPIQLAKILVENDGYGIVKNNFNTFIDAGADRTALENILQLD